MTNRSLRFVFVLALLAPVCARGQEHPIEFSARVLGDRASFRPGDTLTVAAHARIPRGWHLYSITQAPGGPIATTIEVGPAQLIRLAGRIDAPVPEFAFDPNFAIMSEWHEDSAVFRVPLRLARSAPAGKRDVEVRVGYQTCTDRYCLPPREDTLHLAIFIAGPPVIADEIDEPIPVGPSGADAAAAGPLTIVTPQTTVEPAAHPLAAGELLQTRSGSRGFMLFLWLAATMGALSLLTPCVFPMVPITISYFSRGGAVGRNRAVGDALLYGGGIVGAFTGLGLGLSFILGVAGLNRFAASPWLNLGIAALFIVFALSLFGVLQLTVPAGLLTWLDRASSGSRFGRSATTLLMGVTFALTTFTCTAPFVGTLLVSAASGDWRWPAAGLLAFSTVFAVPFLVLALVPHALARLPKSGDWLATMKGSLAFIELGAALKFISNADLVQGWGVFTRQTVIALWLLLAIALTIYLLGLRLQSGKLQMPARPRLVASFVSLALTALLATGLTGRRLGELESFLPPATQHVKGELSWLMDDYEGALLQAAAEAKLVLIDFTGYTCTNCRWMEANMFPRREVASELDHFVRVRLYTDGRTELHRRQQAFEQEMFSTVALPLYAIVDSSGRKRATFLGMTRDIREFLQFLADARTAP